jgi:hypothetical protein
MLDFAERIQNISLACPTMGRYNTRALRGGILQDLHDVMYMSINHRETINNFKEHGRVIVKKSLHKHRLGDVWTNYF